MSYRGRVALSVFVGLLLVGTAGFMLIEHWSLLDSLYMTVITLSTVGYGEIQPLSPVGRLFTGILILFGVGALAYALRWMIETLMEQRLFRWRRTEMELKRIKQHVVVCGFGRMGESVCARLRERQTPLVVIERDPAISDLLDRLGILHLEGDATDDSILIAAGIQRARALAAALPHDADNLFVTLTARSLNGDLIVVASASNEKNEPKMIAAGANRVMNPYRSGGQQIARQLLQPAVTEFFDVITGGVDTGLSLEQVELQPASSLTGVTLREAPIRDEFDVIVVGVRRRDEGLLFNPPSSLDLRAGDVLLALGRRENLRRLEQVAAG
jgi:voltage-gated potassium channel